MKVGLIQMLVGECKAENILKALKLIKVAAKNGAKIITLPECFNSPYGNKYFKEYAESRNGETFTAMSQSALQNKVFLVAGSIPEKDGRKLYNTSFVFSPSGDLIGQFRKMHLFDINIPNKITFKESETLSPGSNFFDFDANGLRVGLGICYDLRFPELAQIYASRGVSLLIYPGAFNMTTGPLHWELLVKARAVDNQVFCAACSPARNKAASYQAWAHSLICDPWGGILAQAGADEELLYAEIDQERMNDVRRQIPIRKQKRLDVYNTSYSLPNQKS